MQKALEYLKHHPAAAGAAILGALVFVYLIFRHAGSSGSGIAGLAASQQAGQLQLAQTNAQLSAQQDQTNAQLAGQEFAAQIQEQESRDQLVASLGSQVIPIQLESQLYEQELLAAEKQQQNLLPLESQAIGQVGKGGSLETAGINELSLLLNQGPAGGFNNLPGGSRTPNPLLVGLGSLIGSAGHGLFG